MQQFVQRMESKAYVRVLVTTKECPLLHSDQIIYSYLHYRAAYGSPVSQQITASRTGFDRSTVAASVARLEGHGLVVDGSATMPEDKRCWFVPANNKAGVLCWTCYVRSEFSPLSTAAVSVLSYLWHCHSTGYSPSAWRLQYLSAVTTLDRKTVKIALDQLAEHHFLQVQYEPFDFTLNSKISDARADYFADKAERAGKSVGGPVKIADFDEEEPAPTVQPEPQEQEQEASGDKTAIRPYKLSAAEIMLGQLFEKRFGVGTERYRLAYSSALKQYKATKDTVELIYHKIVSEMPSPMT